MNCLQVKMDYKEDCKLGFGEYVQVYAEYDITNTMQPYGAISMGAVGNFIPVHELADLENDQAENKDRDTTARRSY